jgi:Asp-tRNA(Asn)/Glu-tRNA(Gln) amidotransferase A subunit family amidase
MAALLDEHDATALAELIRRGIVSPVEVLDESLERIRRVDPRVNAFSELLAESATSRAVAIERRIAAGEDVGPLAGVPVAVKDIVWMRGTVTTAATRARAEFDPPVDAIAVARLLEAGAVVVGKTTNPELCYRGVTKSELFGETRNPWNPDSTPGGSSGGSGAALAYGAVPIALGSDGGGSIRAPASFCGVVGHKPTMGLVPRGPGFRGWETLSVVGPMGRSVRDVQACLDVIAGYHPSDDLSLPSGGPASLGGAWEPERMRIAYSPDLGCAPIEPEVRQIFSEAIADARAAGWNLEPGHPPTEDLSSVWTTLAICEGHAADRGLLQDAPDLLEEDTRSLIRAGAERSAVEYLDAQYERAEYTRRWQEFFAEYDALITPTMQMTALDIGVLAPTSIAGQPVDPLFDDWGAFVFPANLTNMPATTVPCGYDSRGLPVGLQIMGPRSGDAATLSLAAAWERRFADRKRLVAVDELMSADRPL